MNGCAKAVGADDEEVSRRGRVVLGVVCLALLTAGCDQQPIPGAQPQPRSSVGFDVGFDAARYEAEAADAALLRCYSLPGAAQQGNWTAQSLPPHHYIGFYGTTRERRDIEECLDAVPASTVVVSPVTR